MSQWSVVTQFGASTGMINFTFRDLFGICKRNDHLHFIDTNSVRQRKQLFDGRIFHGQALDRNRFPRINMFDPGEVRPSRLV